MVEKPASWLTWLGEVRSERLWPLVCVVAGPHAHSGLVGERQVAGCSSF